MVTLLNRLAARLPQAEFRWLGGLKTIAGRLTFYRGFLTFLMIIPVAYNGSPLLRSAFPNVAVFGLFTFVLLGLAAVLEYTVVYPSQITFNKAQSAKNDRDPIYREARDARREVEALRAQIERLETHLEED